MSGFTFLLMLCLLVPLVVALLFLLLLTYSYRPDEGYTRWVRQSASQWKVDEQAIKRVKPRSVRLETIMADATPIDSDALIETRRMMQNARGFAASGKTAVMARKQRLGQRMKSARNDSKSVRPDVDQDGQL